MQELKLITSPDTSLLEQYNLFEVTSEGSVMQAQSTRTCDVIIEFQDGRQKERWKQFLSSLHPEVEIPH